MQAVSHQVDYTLSVHSMASFTMRKLPYSMRHSQVCREGRERTEARPLPALRCL